MIECRKDRIIIHRATGVGYGVISEIYMYMPICVTHVIYHFLGRGIHFRVLNHDKLPFECPKDKIFVHRASGGGYGVLYGL